jgi:hypothetical protein
MMIKGANMQNKNDDKPQFQNEVSRPNEELANKRVESAIKRIAKAINLLEVTKTELRWACESMDWDDMITYDIENSMATLGASLATLVRWNDDVEQ